MSVTALLTGEAWESIPAAFSAHGLASLHPKTRVLAPDYFGRHLAAVSGLDIVTVPMGEGFRPLPQVMELLVDAVGREPWWRLPAGALPSADNPPAADIAPALPGEIPPPFALTLPWHEPPATRNHVMSSHGPLAVWTLDTGTGYFAGLATCRDAFCPPLTQWRQYGSNAAVFVFNTSPFESPLAAPMERYVILGSGFIGLRAVTDSSPHNGAEVVVYDINPGQLAWTRHVLAGAATHSDIGSLIESFRHLHPDQMIRQVLPHETANARAQADWYANARPNLAAVAERLVWRFEQVDLWANPRPLLQLLTPPVRHTFFLYLDLFQPWIIDGAIPWVADMPDLARGLEAVVRGAAGGEVTFWPPLGEKRVHIHPENPLLDGMGVGR